VHNDSKLANLKPILYDPYVKRKPKKLNVTFTDVPEFKEGEEEAIIVRNRKKYKKDRDMVNLHRLKRKVHRIQIKPNDPILALPYSKYYLSD
jgi:hypothetical protein